MKYRKYSKLYETFHVSEPAKTEPTIFETQQAVDFAAFKGSTSGSLMLHRPDDNSCQESIDKESSVSGSSPSNDDTNPALYVDDVMFEKSIEVPIIKIVGGFIAQTLLCNNCCVQILRRRSWDGLLLDIARQEYYKAGFKARAATTMSTHLLKVVRMSTLSQTRLKLVIQEALEQAESITSRVQDVFKIISQIESDRKQLRCRKLGCPHFKSILTGLLQKRKMDTEDCIALQLVMEFIFAESSLRGSCTLLAPAESIAIAIRLQSHARWTMFLEARGTCHQGVKDRSRFLQVGESQTLVQKWNKLSTQISLCSDIKIFGNLSNLTDDGQLRYSDAEISALLSIAETTYNINKSSALQQYDMSTQVLRVQSDVLAAALPETTLTKALEGLGCYLTAATMLYEMCPPTLNAPHDSMQFVSGNFVSPEQFVRILLCPDLDDFVRPCKFISHERRQQYHSLPKYQQEHLVRIVAKNVTMEMSNRGQPIVFKLNSCRFYIMIPEMYQELVHPMLVAGIKVYQHLLRIEPRQRIPDEWLLSDKFKLCCDRVLIGKGLHSCVYVKKMNRECYRRHDSPFREFFDMVKTLLCDASEPCSVSVKRNRFIDNIKAQEIHDLLTSKN